jgi:hypothetical protein
MGVIINGGINVGSGGILINSGLYIPPQSPIVRTGLVLELDAGNTNSYPGSGTTWTDISGNGYPAATLVNGPTFSSNNNGLIVLDGINDYISISGSTTIYSSDFTWQCFHFTNTPNQDLNGMWWSEISELSSKNFLIGYLNTTLTSTYMRIDTTGGGVFTSPSNGTQTNGFGSTAGPLVGKWTFTTIVKSGTTLSLYWDNAVLMWTLPNAGWSIPFNTQAITLGARGDALYASKFNISNNLMYNRALSTLEITQNYDAYKSRFGL